MFEHETLEEQHGCHSQIGTNDGNTMTTAAEVKDELRRQKKQFNKPEEATKFLDVLRISVTPATAGISSVDLPAREVSQATRTSSAAARRCGRALRFSGRRPDGEGRSEHRGDVVDQNSDGRISIH